jgi:hypothetical protein
MTVRTSFTPTTAYDPDLQLVLVGGVQRNRSISGSTETFGIPPSPGLTGAWITLQVVNNGWKDTVSYQGRIWPVGTPPTPTAIPIPTPSPSAARVPSLPSVGVSANSPAQTQVLTEPGGATSAPTTTCRSPKYVSGFKALHDLLGDAMSAAKTCEYADPNGTGDIHQVGTSRRLGAADARANARATRTVAALDRARAREQLIGSPRTDGNRKPSSIRAYSRKATR